MPPGKSQWSQTHWWTRRENLPGTWSSCPWSGRPILVTRFYSFSLARPWPRWQMQLPKPLWEPPQPGPQALLPPHPERFCSTRLICYLVFSQRRSYFPFFEPDLSWLTLHQGGVRNCTEGKVNFFFKTGEWAYVHLTSLLRLHWNKSK